MGLDEKYANAIREGIMPEYTGQPTNMQVAQSGVAAIAGRPLNAKESMFADDGTDRIAPDKFMKAVGATARYGVPLGGITLAGKGLYDLTGMFIQENEQTGGTLMP